MKAFKLDIYRDNELVLRLTKICYLFWKGTNLI